MQFARVRTGSLSLGSIPSSIQFAPSVMAAQGKSETPRGGVGIKCPERFDSAARYKFMEVCEQGAQAVLKTAPPQG